MVSERVSLLPSPRHPGPRGLHDVETRVKLACVHPTSPKTPSGGRQCFHTAQRNDRRLRTAVSKPRATGPSPGFHKYCLTSQRSLLAPRFHANVLYLSFLTPGRFRHDVRRALNRLRSLVQQRSVFAIRLHEYVNAFPFLSAAAGSQRDDLPHLVYFWSWTGKMEGWVLRHPHLDVRSHFNMTLNISAAQDSSPWTSTNATRNLIGSLQLAQVQTLRTMHLTLGAFSLGLVLLTVHRIISDAKRAASLQVTLRKR